MRTERRLVFGEVAELYDRHRPTYPEPLVEDIAALVPAGTRALEVGAGTGKATRLIAARGIPVVAIEPSAEMARIARGAALPQVTVIESDFETFDPGPEGFGLVYSAQAWHWIDPERRYALARRALASGGRLAVFFNRPAWADSPVRAALSDVYRATAPAMATAGPLHPDNPSPDRDIDEDWAAQIDGAPGLDDPETREYRWSLGYSDASFAGMLATVSEVRLLAPDTRERLLDGVRAAIGAHGGELVMPMVTRLYLARAV